MKLIVGLGNPGEKYEKTRHNLGFSVLDKLLKDIASVKNSSFEKNDKFKSDIANFEWSKKSGETEKIILVKPLTFMNNSGMAVAIISNFYKVLPKDIWVVHDELDLPIGNLKIRLGGSGAGHHGVESIIEALGTDKFYRFRLGIGYAKNKQEIAKHKVKADEFVLDRFNEHESGNVKHLIKKGVKSLEDALEDGIEKAQNRFNN